MNQRSIVLPTAVAATAVSCVEQIAAAYADFPWEEPGVYANWTAQTYYYVRHATRLLSLAAARCSVSDEELHRVFLKGIREEQGHEALAMNDLKQLGYTPADFAELPEASTYYQSLYYAIEHDGPAALLGYFLALEGLAALKMENALRRVQAAYTDQAAGFFRIHCQLDVDHFDEGLRNLEMLDSDKLAAVEKNLTLSTALYIRLVDRIKQPRRPTPNE